ncbi:hypothetical protein HD806DRAFT_481183 [Xylariaceae sp. AK1471]|nr:hypothetical protein HD806DRAFT_481183 [Xylariaceae sp. AK1471]
MTDDFFATAPSTFADYNITGDQLSALKACIEGQTTPVETAKRLTAHPTAAPTPLETQQRLGGLWTLLNDAAVALPSAQPKIISILQAIRELPRVEVPRGEGEDFIDLDDGFFWRELTGWANDWADNYNGHGSRFSNEAYSAQERARYKDTWISANTYTARLAAAGDPALASYGAALDRASLFIVQALELDYGEEQPAHLEAAAELFIHAAPELYRRSKERSSDVANLGHARNGKVGRPLINENTRGIGGYSLELWNFWRERWTAFAAKQSFSDEARRAAREALTAMEKAAGA